MELLRLDAESMSVLRALTSSLKKPSEEEVWEQRRFELVKSFILSGYAGEEAVEQADEVIRKLRK